MLTADQQSLLTAISAKKNNLQEMGGAQAARRPAGLSRIGAP
jgi:hypothetical protein